MIHWLVLLAVIWTVVNAQSCPPIVGRSQWGASRTSCKSSLRTPVPGVIIHHTAGGPCKSRDQCSKQMRNIQNYHIRTRKWCDIGYNFLIGEDGAVYEGRGWTTQGAHAKSFNNNIGICFIGTFSNSAPNTAALNAARRLIACGVARNFITRNYRLRGHRNVNPTSCPGEGLYKVIKGWPRFSA